MWDRGCLGQDIERVTREPVGDPEGRDLYAAEGRGRAERRARGWSWRGELGGGT